MTSRTYPVAAPGRRARRWPRAAGRTLSGIVLTVLFGCSAISTVPGTARAEGALDDAAPVGPDVGPDAEPQVGPQVGPRVRPDADRADAPAAFDGELMYELLIAELAGRRGQLDEAMRRYLDVAGRSDDARIADRAARLAMFARRWPEAERAARRWIALDADAPEAHELLARALLMQDKREAAAREYVALVGTATSEATRGELLRGLSATLQGEDPARAMAVFEALAAAYPDAAESHLGVARVALATNDRERALAATAAALVAEPANADALLLRARVLAASGRADEGLEALAAALAAAPENVALRLGYAQLLAGSGRTEDALAEFERLYAQAPDDADVLLTIGLLALDAERPAPARRYLEALLATGGHPEQANFYLARLDDAEQKRAAAIERYEAVPPGELYADARIRAAELRALDGDVEGARAHLADLAAELPDPALQPRLIVADSRILERAGDSAEALAVLETGLGRFPDDAELLYARALAADNAGDPATLERDLARLIEMEPDNAHALNALGYHFADADRRLDEAERYLEKAASLEPDDAAILDSLGWLRYRQGKLDDAVTLLRRAHALYPDGEIAAHLGEVLWTRGDKVEARAVWDAALAQTPDDEVLKRVIEKFVD